MDINLDIAAQNNT